MVDQTEFTSTVDDLEMDFLTLLEESFAVEQPTRGDIVTGVVLTVDSMGLLVDLGMKRDGVVSRNDLEKLGDDVDFHVGDEIPVMIVRTEDREGNMIVSISQAKQNEDWLKAEEMMNNEDIYDSEVADANRGGLIVPFGNLRGFIPASHVVELPRGLSEDERKDHLARMVGQPISVKVIEVNRRRRRLVLSQREAQREIRDASKDALLAELVEGETRQGVVSGLRDFGAFVDLGGADGLIHISELAWHRVKHPRELLKVGDKIDVYILRLDQDGRRIGLSLKRLQPNPWSQVDEMYHVGQVVEGVISRVTQFGAFVSLDPGIEALLHASQISDPPPEDPSLMLHEGMVLNARIISIESHRQRLGLSIRDVADSGVMLDGGFDAEDADDIDADDVVADDIDADDGDTNDVDADDTDGAADAETTEAEAEIEAGENAPDAVESGVVETVAEEEPIAE
ncbi:MAG: S1 RNA-binding domain-containing protein [Chloroflexi bacterium]|nr:S1 RNA-binding domain-containing protein [Chloroflexota bacterium]